MKIVFRQITIDNFLSIGHASLNLNSPGVTLVAGINTCDPLSASNGSGKSSIFEAILWNLTGATSRGSSHVSNQATGGSASVTLAFTADSVPYEITRQADPSSLRIIKDGEDVSGNTFSKSKKVLADLLSFIDYDMLSSIIILTQGLGGRLSNLKPSERKARLEMFSVLQGLVDEVTAKVGEASGKISGRHGTASKELADIETRIARNRELATEYRAKIEEMAEARNRVLPDSEIAELKETLAEYTEALEDTEKRLAEAVASRNENLSRQREREADLARFAKETKELKEQYMAVLNSVCPTCGQAIDNTELLAKYETRIQEVSRGIEEAKADLDSAKHELSYDGTSLLEKSRSDIRKGIQMANELIAESARYSSSTEAWESMAAKLETENGELGERAFPLRTEVSSLDKDLEIAKWYKASIPRKFRNFLLDSVVEYLNRRLEHYSAYLFTDRKVRLVSDGNTLSIMLDNLEFENLSGGEGRRADLLIQLALRDLAINQSGFYCNLLVMDEVFDYLDDTGINSFMVMIDKESSFSESLMVITHRTGIDIPVSRKITVTKDAQGISSAKVSGAGY